MSLAPGNPGPQYNLGVVLAAAGQHGEALQAYEAALGVAKQQPQIWCNAGIAAARLGRLSVADKYLREAVRLDPQDAITRDATISLARQVQQRDLQEKLTALDDAAVNHTAGLEPGASWLPLATTAVAVRDHSGLSFREFYESFASTGTPVVIRGAVGVDLVDQWSLDRIRRACGHVHAGAALRRPQPGVWAGLAGDASSNATISSLLDSLEGGSGAGLPTPYLFDFNVQRHCPAALKHWRYALALSAIRTVPLCC